MNQEIADRLTTLLTELNDLLIEAADEALEKQLKINPKMNQGIFLRFAYLSLYNQVVKNLSLLVAETYGKGLKIEDYRGESLR